jgi:hypothetical protein
MAKVTGTLSQIVVFSLIAMFLCLNYAYCDSNIPQKRNELSAVETGKNSVANNNPSLYRNDNKTNENPNSSPQEKELVVVSKTPELFSYSLTGISVLLSVIVIVIGIITGVGLAIVLKVDRERKKLERAKNELIEKQQGILKELESEHKSMLISLKKTAYRLKDFSIVKGNLEILLSEASPDSKKAYELIQKTVLYPDKECLHLYAKALNKFEKDINIIRIVRNGIISYVRRSVNLN